MVKADETTLPSYWARYLVNGDDSGLGPDEKRRADKAISALKPWYVVGTVYDSARFTWSYDLFDPESGIRGGDVMDYVIHKSEES